MYENREEFITTMKEYVDLVKALRPKFGSGPTWAEVQADEDLVRSTLLVGSAITGLVDLELADPSQRGKSPIGFGRGGLLHEVAHLFQATTLERPPSEPTLQGVCDFLIAHLENRIARADEVINGFA